MESTDIFSVVLFLLGAFVLAAAAFDWGWALTRRRGRPLGDRRRARVTYAILGGVLLVWNAVRILQIVLR